MAMIHEITKLVGKHKRRTRIGRGPGFEDGATVDIQALAAKHLVSSDQLPLKVLGEGELTKKLTVKAAKYSASAKQKIEKAGGTADAAA